MANGEVLSQEEVQRLLNMMSWTPTTQSECNGAKEKQTNEEEYAMGIFEKQDKMVEERKAKKQQERDAELRQLANAVTEDVLGVPDKPKDKIEVFESGATRNAVDCRYDLMSVPVTAVLLGDHPVAKRFVLNLFEYYNGKDTEVVSYLAETLQVNPYDLVYLYAQAMHEGASKYGEGNWLKGIPESNLLNHALHHLFKFVAGDTSEDHRSHLVWNVFTLIHFRLVAEQTKS